MGGTTGALLTPGSRPFRSVLMGTRAFLLPASSITLISFKENQEKDEHDDEDQRIDRKRDKLYRNRIAAFTSTTSTFQCGGRNSAKCRRAAAACSFTSMLCGLKATRSQPYRF